MIVDTGSTMVENQPLLQLCTSLSGEVTDVKRTMPSDENNTVYNTLIRTYYAHDSHIITSKGHFI